MAKNHNYQNDNPSCHYTLHDCAAAYDVEQSGNAANYGCGNQQYDRHLFIPRQFRPCGAFRSLHVAAVGFRLDDRSSRHHEPNSPCRSVRIWCANTRRQLVTVWPDVMNSKCGHLFSFPVADTFEQKMTRRRCIQRGNLLAYDSVSISSGFSQLSCLAGKISRATLKSCGGHQTKFQHFRYLRLFVSNLIPQGCQQ